MCRVGSFGERGKPPQPRVGAVTDRDDGMGHVRVEGLRALCGAGERMFRRTRATMVVSRARMFSTSLGVGSAEPEPPLVHGVVGFGEVSDDFGDRHTSAR